MTGGYIYTLPLVSLTALSEPLILSRINPKYALFGGLNAAYNGLASGLRTVFPKLPRTESEKKYLEVFYKVLMVHTLAEIW